MGITILILVILYGPTVSSVSAEFSSSGACDAAGEAMKERLRDDARRVYYGCMAK